MTATPLLEVRGVDRSFGGVRALQKMDLILDHGEPAALIGPNGSGKSTLVNAISRMVNVDAGHVLVEGVDVTRERPHRMSRRGVARTFQHVRLVPELTLRENASSGGIAALERPGGRERTWVRGLRRSGTTPEVEAALDLMEVSEDDRDKLPGAVPYAVQRHAEVARALAAQPKMLLLDEPVAGMNPDEVLVFLRLLRSINGAGIATLLIDHNIEFVMQAAKTITVINRGQRIAHGAADTVRRDPAVIEAYLGARHARTQENEDV